VNRIAEMCGLRAHQACEHLRLLKGFGLLDSRRSGRQVFYEIASPQLPGLLNCIRNNCPDVNAPDQREMDDSLTG